MNAKKTIQKFLFVTLWVGIGTSMLVLLIAAIGNRSKQVCTGYEINVLGIERNFFLTDEEVTRLLCTATESKVKGKPVASFNLRGLESMLERRVEVNDAELYFDNRNKLHVTVREREPVARVMTTAGSSFYLDKDARRLPVSDRMTARVIVVTDFPDNPKWKRSDSMLARQVRDLSLFLVRHPFWNAQAGQIDITSDRRFDMVPAVGNHVVELGDANNLEDKFHRLYVFYKQVLRRAGMDRYRIIKVQFDGQVVGVRSDPDSGPYLYPNQATDKNFIAGRNGRPNAVAPTIDPGDTPSKPSDQATIPTPGRQPKALMPPKEKRQEE